MKRKARFLPLLIGIIMLVPGSFITTNIKAQNTITSPENYFGFQMGSDRKLARWDKIVEYFNKIEKESDRLKVVNMGHSSEGHPFLLLIISSPENLANLDRLQLINKKISDSRGVSKDSINKYIQEGKAVVFQSMSLHASEVGGTQMTPELTYDLLTRNDKETKRILDNVLCFMIPCINPDGQVMITDWYKETVGTKYEGLYSPIQLTSRQYCETV